MESFESLNSYKEAADKISEIRVDIQNALIFSGAPWEGRKDQFDHYVLDWIEKNARTYADAFNVLMKERPNLEVDWTERREEVIADIKRLMELEAEKVAKAA